MRDHAAVEQDEFQPQRSVKLSRPDQESSDAGQVSSELSQSLMVIGRWSKEHSR